MMLTDISTVTNGGLSVNALLDMTVEEIHYIAEELNKRVKDND